MLRKEATRSPKAKTAGPINTTCICKAVILPPTIKALIPDYNCSGSSSLRQPATTFDHIIPLIDGTFRHPRILLIP